MRQIFISKIDLKGMKLQDVGTVKQSWLQIFRLGRWNHPRYGKLEFTSDMFDGFVKNFNENVRKVDLAIDSEHQPEKGACAWIKKLENRDGGLWALVEWTPWGLELVEQGLFRYLSGDFDYEWKDEESGKKYQNVLFGAALTNRPFIKGMSPINLSEFKEELEKDGDIRSAFQLAEDIIKLKEGEKVKTDAEILAAKDDDLSVDEKARKADLLKKKEEEEAVQLKKKLAERAKRVGLSEDAKEDEIEKKEKEKEKELQDATEARKARAKAVGLPEDATEAEISKAEEAKKNLAERAKKVKLSENATLAEVEAAEKKLQETIGNENEQKVKLAVALGLSQDATTAEIEAAATKAIGAIRAIEGNKPLSAEEISKVLTDESSIEKKLTELKESKGDSLTIKLLEETLASKKQLREEQIRNTKDKIELKLKEHFRQGKMTSKEHTTLKAMLLSAVEGTEPSFKLSEKDKDGKDVEATKILSEIVDSILTERPAIVELKELAIKELAEPPKGDGKELKEGEAEEIGAQVAGGVTKLTKSAKKLAERAKKVGLSETATKEEVEVAEKRLKE